MKQLEFITDVAIYEKVLLEAIPSAERFVWIATADIKDLYVARGRKMAPFLATLSSLVDCGVALRLIHAKEPGPAFRRDFDKYPNLISGLERILCPRVHFKCVVVDGAFAYSGSANLTGAGMGAKSGDRRNFESGTLTRAPELVEAVMEQYDSVWRGAHCPTCRRKQYCADFRDMIQ